MVISYNIRIKNFHYCTIFVRWLHIVQHPHVCQFSWLSISRSGHCWRGESLWWKILYWRKILNNRKVVNGEPNQTSTPVSVVHNCGRKIFRNGRRLSMCRSDHWGGESLCLLHWCQMLKMTIVISFHILPYLLLFCHIFSYHLMSIIYQHISIDVHLMQHCKH